jgi:hypothetical protein
MERSQAAVFGAPGMFHVEGLAVQAIASHSNAAVLRSSKMFHVEHLCRLPRMFSRFAKNWTGRPDKSGLTSAVTEVLEKCTISVNWREGEGGIFTPLTKTCSVGTPCAARFPLRRTGSNAAEPGFVYASILRRMPGILGNRKTIISRSLEERCRTEGLQQGQR